MPIALTISFTNRHVILLSDEQCLWVLCTSTAPLTALGGSGGIIFHFKGSFKLRFYQGPCKDIFFRKINLALPDLCRVSLHQLILFLTMITSTRYKKGAFCNLDLSRTYYGSYSIFCTDTASAKNALARVPF